MLLNLCYVLRAMEVINVSNSKSDHQGHSRALALVPFDRRHTISYFRYIITYLQNLKRSRDFKHILLGIIYRTCTRTPLYQSVHEI